MELFRFRQFKVYGEAKNFHLLVVEQTREFPREFRFLSDQLRRSSLSVLLNIAEGSAKLSDRDFNRFIQMALGSINEAVAGLDVARSNGLITDATFQNLLIRAESITKQLGGFSRSLLARS